jgi:hypothetical protein
MPLNFKLPEGIWAIRLGYYPESEYDIDGMLAPVTWICNCGYHFPTARLEWENDDRYYVLVSEEERNQFLSEHVGCTAKCYKCHTTPVDRYGMWCDPCEEKEDSFLP